ncbi:MttB3 [Desulfamplus magnetovallimortis]|uniref:Methyltransferase n=1 Tax=Desulfamplus magnetovallimortis TaxID=1246637 RepID=A0A1W1HCX8_9BACT|nr:trimethylamine methyltransferase family protein [Desulfamplus magnetovallimortis]SLM30235.1 MttB3 [Desulfamplus magnetovallimortis]
MYDRMQTITKGEIELLHNASMNILKNTGVTFNEPEALELFRQNGFKVEGKTVYFEEEKLLKAVEDAPSRFKIEARSPEKSLYIGEDDWVFVPTYGAPFIMDKNGNQRPGTMEDYANICKLVHTSEHINMNGFKHIEPSNVVEGTAYLEMLFANITLCDKPFMGSTDTIQSAKDTMEMIAIAFGGRETIKDKVVTIGLINPLSPLQFAEEMAGSIIEYARNGQALVILNMIMGGTSGPVSLPGLFALMNAEILAGLTLAQIVNPGTPVIYGTTSCPTNMQTGAATIGSPETWIINSVTTQMARYYKLPCRTGGSLTDSHVPDAQALAEGALSLSTSVRNGANFILHSCGMMGTFIGNNLEKWIIDEELCGMIRRMLTPIDITMESINVDSIKKVGIGGNYLMDPDTVKNCRTAFYKTSLYNKKDHSSWKKTGAKTIDEIASEQLVKRLAEYERPEIDPEVEIALADFITHRKQNM